MTVIGQYAEIDSLQQTFHQYQDIQKTDWWLQMQTEDTNNNGNWYSVADALKKLNVSRNTLYSKIKTNQINNKKEGKYRFVWIDDETDLFSDLFSNQTNAHTNINTNTDRGKDLEQRLSYFMDKVDSLELELSKTRERHDTIIARITEQNQMLLQSARKPFWKFWG